jgi:outer membrane protein assembly factor BamB
MCLRPFVLLAALCFLDEAAGARAQVTPAATPAKVQSPYSPLKKCWEYPIENTGRPTVELLNGTVFIAETEGRIRALNAHTGAVNWVTELGGRTSGMLAIPGTGVAVVTSNPSSKASLRLLAADSGLVKYSVAFEASDNIYLRSNGSRLIIADRPGAVTAFEASTGETVWNLNLSAKLTTTPAVSATSLVVATDDKRLSVIAIASGKVMSKIPTDKNVTALAIRENEMIVAGNDRGTVTNYRDFSGQVWWRFKSGARVGTITETPAGILIGSYDNFLYQLSVFSGDVKWKRRLDGRIINPPVVFGEHILAASSTEGNAHVIEIESGKSIDQLLFGENRFMLASPSTLPADLAIFTLVDSIAAYTSVGCTAK